MDVAGHLLGFEIGIIIAGSAIIIFHIMAMIAPVRPTHITKMQVEMYKRNIEDLENATQEEKKET